MCPVIVCLYGLWVYLCIVCIPIQSIHGLLCGGYLCDIDVPVPQVFLYVSVPEWVQGPLAVLLTGGSVSSSLVSRGKENRVHWEEEGRETLKLWHWTQVS